MGLSVASSACPPPSVTPRSRCSSSASRLGTAFRTFACRSAIAPASAAAVPLIRSTRPIVFTRAISAICAGDGFCPERPVSSRHNRPGGARRPFQRGFQPGRRGHCRLESRIDQRQAPRKAIGHMEARREERGFPGELGGHEFASFVGRGSPDPALRQTFGLPFRRGQRPAPNTLALQACVVRRFVAGFTLTAGLGFAKLTLHRPFRPNRRSGILRLLGTTAAATVVGCRQSQPPPASIP